VLKYDAGKNNIKETISKIFPLYQKLAIRKFTIYMILFLYIFVRIVLSICFFKANISMGKQEFTATVIKVLDMDATYVIIPFVVKKEFGRKSHDFTLSHSNRKEYVKWITDAKRQETREKRLEKIIELLLNKKKNPSDNT